MGKSKELGDWGERQAARYLIQKGFRLVTHNYRCPWGEIDLVMDDGCFLAFVEVKLRKSGRYGTPGEYVTASKREKLRKTALHYLQAHPTDLQPRFDVVEIYAPDGLRTNPVPIRHIENAF